MNWTKATFINKSGIVPIYQYVKVLWRPSRDQGFLDFIRLRGPILFLLIVRRVIDFDMHVIEMNVQLLHLSAPEPVASLKFKRYKVSLPVSVVCRQNVSLGSKYSYGKPFKSDFLHFESKKQCQWADHATILTPSFSNENYMINVKRRGMTKSFGLIWYLIIFSALHALIKNNK